MDYAIAKQISVELHAEHRRASDILAGFPRAANGLTPDAIKFSAEFRQAKQAYEVAFYNLRQFNATYTRTFKKELAAERAARRAR